MSDNKLAFSRNYIENNERIIEGYQQCELPGQSEIQFKNTITIADVYLGSCPKLNFAVSSQGRLNKKECRKVIPRLNLYQHVGKFPIRNCALIGYPRQLGKFKKEKLAAPGQNSKLSPYKNSNNEFLITGHRLMHVGCNIYGLDNLNGIHHDCTTYPNSSGGVLACYVNTHWQLVGIAVSSNCIYQGSSLKECYSLEEGVGIKSNAINYAAPIPDLNGTQYYNIKENSK